MNAILTGNDLTKFEDWNFIEIKSGDTLDLGSGKFVFIEAPMLHWPDSMFTYYTTDEILFSNDAFGQHYADVENFDDEVGTAIMKHAKKYFANILLPFSPMVTGLMNKLDELDLDIALLCPDHGPVWRSDIGGILNRWREWALQKCTRKAVVIYDTMWGSTARMADAVCDGLVQEGISVTVMPLGSSHRSDVATAVLDSGALIAGSPTINGQMFPRMADVLTYLKGLKPKNLIGGVFGSYGWSGEAVKHIQAFLGEMGIPVIGDPLNVNYVPDHDQLRTARDLGSKIGRELVERCSE